MAIKSLPMTETIGRELKLPKASAAHTVSPNETLRLYGAGAFYLRGYMAQRRMVAIKIVDTDNFIEMPHSARLLYYEFLVRADDDGFIAAPKKILKFTGCAEDDFKILCAKQFIIPFNSGICVIKDWKIHNYIQSDRYHKTIYSDELSALKIDENGSYLKMDTKCIHLDSKVDTEVRLGKIRLGKDIKKGFIKPVLEELKSYIDNKKYNVDAESFLAFYESNGWKVGKNPMRSWEHALVTWHKRAGTKSESKVDKYMEDLRRREGV